MNKNETYVRTLTETLKPQMTQEEDRTVPYPHRMFSLSVQLNHIFFTPK